MVRAEKSEEKSHGTPQEKCGSDLPSEYQLTLSTGQPARNLTPNKCSFCSVSARSING